MAVASSPAGLVLVGPAFEIVFGIVHAQNSNNIRKSKNNDHACTSKYVKTCSKAKLPAAYMYLLPACHVFIAIINIILTVDQCGHTWSWRWRLTTPPEGRASNIAACIVRP